MKTNTSSDLLNEFKQIVLRHEKALTDSLKLDLTLREMQLLYVLNLLQKNKNNTSTVLAIKLNVSPSAVSIMINKLEGKGYVKRNYTQTDRRKTALVLLEKSDLPINRYTNHFFKLDQLLASNYSQNQINSFYSILKSIEDFNSKT